MFPAATAVTAARNAVRRSSISVTNVEGSAVAQWTSAWLETEGPRVRASPASLRCGP